MVTNSDRIIPNLGRAWPIYSPEVQCYADGNSFKIAQTIRGIVNALFDQFKDDDTCLNQLETIQIIVKVKIEESLPTLKGDFNEQENDFFYLKRNIITATTSYYP